MNIIEKQLKLWLQVGGLFGALISLIAVIIEIFLILAVIFAVFIAVVKLDEYATADNEKQKFENDKINSDAI